MMTTTTTIPGLIAAEAIDAAVTELTARLQVFGYEPGCWLNWADVREQLRVDPARQEYLHAIEQRLSELLQPDQEI
ncbi:MAG TPA: hypothetical protein VMP01_27145 [Pirellulaceae bacterium]|nr:hypothetical protein [Pirellulaceae bacterium]